MSRQLGDRAEGLRHDHPDIPPRSRTRTPRTPRKPVAAQIEDGELSREQAVEMARESVLRTLSAAAKSRAELVASLARKGFPEEVANQVLDRLGAVGLINDADYAEMLVRTRFHERGLARRAIAVELRRRGVPESEASCALEQVTDDDETKASIRLAIKVIARTSATTGEARVRRAAAVLARKGYSQSVTYSAVKAALAAEGEELEGEELADGLDD